MAAFRQQAFHAKAGQTESCALGLIDVRTADDFDRLLQSGTFHFDSHVDSAWCRGDEFDFEWRPQLFPLANFLHWFPANFIS